MKDSTTKVLVKIFAKGFYKENSGLLLFLFVVIMSHIFWMKPLGGHLTSDQQLYHHLIVLIYFAKDPVLMLMIFIVWFVYTYKSWGFVRKQFLEDENRFLSYSINSMNLRKQFNTWGYVQFVILLPAIILAGATVVIGIIYDYYLIPFIILLYLTFLIALSAILYTKWNIGVNQSFFGSFFWQVLKKLKKSLDTLFLYQLFHKYKLGFFFVKLFSISVILGDLYYFSDLEGDFRMDYLVLLLISIGHSLIIYENHRFESTLLMFSRNFPYSKARIFFGFIKLYLIISLPEQVWILFNYSAIEGFQLLIFSLGLALLSRCVLMLIGLNIKGYLKWVFTLFITSFIAIMFGCFWIIDAFPILAFMIFYRNYHKQNGVVEKQKN
jgi:hypothetical protein